MIIHGDANDIVKDLKGDSVDMVFSSPSPYMSGETKGIGSEDRWDEYLNNLINLFHFQTWRVLKPAGSMYIQLADYHDSFGSMTLIPERFMLRMRYLGWLVRSKPIWIRTEKFTIMDDYNRYTRDWEHILFFTRSKDYYFNNPQKKIHSSVNYHDYHNPGNNFESGFPEKIIERCIHFSCPTGGTVLDPLSGHGTTGVVAKRMKRDYILIDIDEAKVMGMRARLGKKEVEKIV